MSRILSLDASNYQKHFIHGENRTWIETNCYSDLLIELLHSMGHDPVPALAFTLAIDFEGDQWTFFKFPHEDLFQLYGLEIKELNPWKSLLQSVEEQVQYGNPVLIELDSYFLPDTNGTAYQRAHVKSTVAVNELKIAEQFLGYFHNQGYYSLSGDDFKNIFQTEGLVHERMLPPYIEFVKRHLERKLGDAEQLEVSLLLLKRHIQRMPTQNPFIVFKARFEKDLKWLMEDSIEIFHLYSFANLRQYGACFELAETYLRWISEKSKIDLSTSISAFQQISQTAKAFQFQLARSMARKKPLDLTALDSMAQLWSDAQSQLKEKFL